MSSHETDSLSEETRNKRFDAEVGMVRVMEEMIGVPYDYLTYVIDPRNFSSSQENVSASLGIARKGAIARVTTEEELDQCVIIKPAIIEGKFGIIVESSRKQAVPGELGPCIDRLATGVRSLKEAIEMFAPKQ